jgi:hypothetical protein
MNIIPNNIKKAINYNSKTGGFTWRESPTNSKIKKGESAGTVNRGYLKLKVDGKVYFAHRVAWYLTYDKLPKGEIDHINHIKTDNRICNLRDVSHSENMRNQSIAKNNKSGTLGVFWSKKDKMWVSKITINSNRIYLGAYKDKELAIFIRKEAESVYKFHNNHGCEAL